MADSNTLKEQLKALAEKICHSWDLLTPLHAFSQQDSDIVNQLKCPEIFQLIL